MSKRRRLSDDFKAKVALEALLGDQTLSQIAARHKLHPNQISQWKQQALDGLKGHVWSYEFVADRTHDGPAFRMLTVIDEYTRECLAIHVWDVVTH